MIRVALAVITMLLTVVQPAIAQQQYDGAFWLEQYEDATWNPAATFYVLGVFPRCPELRRNPMSNTGSPRTMAAMMADVVKQSPKKNEPALNYVLKTAVRLSCVVDTNLIHRAADMREKETKR